MNYNIKNIIGKYTLPEEKIIKKKYKKCLKIISNQCLYFYLNGNSISKEYSIHNSNCVSIIYKFKTLDCIDINRLEKLCWYIIYINRIDKTISLHINIKNLNIKDKLEINELIKNKSNIEYNNPNFKLNISILIVSVFLLYKYYLI